MMALSCAEIVRGVGNGEFVRGVGNGEFVRGIGNGEFVRGVGHLVDADDVLDARVKERLGHLQGSGVEGECA